MKVNIDTDTRQLVVERDGARQSLALYSPEAFSVLSELWVKVGWELKYSYAFSWMGRPVIQLPEDMIRIQEVIYRVRPDIVIETGVAHGGSLIFYASLFRAMGNGKVIGVDIEIRPNNRKAIEAHELSSYITLVEGSSTDLGTVAKVRDMVRPTDKVLVILDSDHSKAHVSNELAAYASFVTPGSYIVATDGIMQILDDVPRGKPEWKHDNAVEAAVDFARNHPEFVLEEPAFPFNEGAVKERITHWPKAYLRRR
jgi:cephalosporin hydroxylase